MKVPQECTLRSLEISQGSSRFEHQCPLRLNLSTSSSAGQALHASKEDKWAAVDKPCLGKPQCSTSTILQKGNCIKPFKSWNMMASYSSMYCAGNHKVLVNWWQASAMNFRDLVKAIANFSTSPKAIKTVLYACKSKHNEPPIKCRSNSNDSTSLQKQLQCNVTCRKWVSATNLASPQDANAVQLCILQEVIAMIPESCKCYHSTVLTIRCELCKIGNGIAKLCSQWGTNSMGCHGFCAGWTQHHHLLHCELWQVIAMDCVSHKSNHNKCQSIMMMMTSVKQKLAAMMIANNCGWKSIQVWTKLDNQPVLTCQW